MQVDKRKNIAPIKGRVRNYLYDKGIRMTDFFSATGLSESAFRGKIASSEFGGAALATIVRVYPEISAHWLLTGEGAKTQNVSGRDITQSIIGHGNSFHIGESGRTSPSGEAYDKSPSHLEIILSEKEKSIDMLTRVVAMLEEQMKTKDAQIRALTDALCGKTGG